jgi:hypothetical protein
MKAIGTLNNGSVSSPIGTTGFVIQTKKWVVQDRDMDEHYHPDVDLDPQGMPCVTLAVSNIEGDVLLCLQMVLGPGSPRIHLSESRADGITFEQAAQWYVISLSTPLQCVIENMNKKSKIKEDCEALFPETLSGPSRDGDGGRDRDREGKRDGEEENKNSYSALEISNPKQREREQLACADILESTVEATQNPADWAESFIQKVDQCHLPSVPHSGSATPGSVWSRRSSV